MTIARGQRAHNDQTCGRFTQAQTAVFALMLACIPLGTLCGCASTNGTATARNAQGVEYFSSGQYDEAITLFQDSLDDNPNSAETYYNLGSAYQRKAMETGDAKLLAQAEDAYWTALELSPAPETIVCCYRGIATSAMAQGEANEALQILEEWRDRNPNSIEPKLEIAYLLEAQDRDDDAYAILKDVAEEAPDDYRAFYKMGALSERAGDLSDAVENASIAKRLNPNDATVAQRANLLEAQYAAQQRKSQSEKHSEETLSESAVIADATATQTARVPSTSAQTEQPLNQDPPVEMVLPTDETEQNETPIQNQGAQSTQLGFSEPIAFSSQEASARITSTQRERQAVQRGAVLQSDNDVKWIVNQEAMKQTGTIAQTSATIPSSDSSATGVNQPVFTAPDVATTTGVTVAAAATASNATTTTSAETANLAQAQEAPSAPATSLSQSKAKTTRMIRARPSLHTGPPNIQAGNFF
ncbi:MAG: tetratricopeptide repeat protein [Planctomycetia bacterium]|nr:tetratricopeptide repeat protein [Planctomycetia bacterium]